MIANKRRICYFPSMSVRSCRVTVQDIDGVSHTVDVTAATLYEAVAQGLAAIRGNEWVAGIAEGFNVVKVSVADIRVEQRSQAGRFHKVAGEDGRFSARRKPAPPNSVDSEHASFPIEAKFLAPNWNLDKTGLAAKKPDWIQAQEG